MGRRAKSGDRGPSRLQQPEFTLTWREDRLLWYVRWTERGRSRRRSTGSSDRDAAEAFLSSFVAAYESAIEPDQKNVKTVVDAYLADRKGHVVDYGRLESLAKVLKRQLGWLTIEEIRPSTSRLYAQRRRKLGAGNGTIKRELGGLNAALNWAVEEKWIDAPAPAIKLPPRPPSRDRWLSREEASRLIDAAKSEHISLFIHIALHTAARRGAILELKWTQVDWIRNRSAFNPAGRVQTAKKRAVVPINDTLRQVLTRAFQLRQSDHVIEWNGGPAGIIKKAFERTA